MTITRSPVKARKRVIVRFAGDSGDGMQLAGSRFTDATAEHGNDFATLPSFPAEIRAPAGTLAGVSAFQIHFAAQDILTPGDEPDVLVAMNPAALRSELPALAKRGTVIANEDAFSKRNLQKAGYESNPLEDGSLDGYHLIRIPMTSLTDERDRGDRGRLDARRGAREEPVRARRRLVALRPPDGADRGLAAAQVRQQARPAGGQPRRLPRRLELRRDVRADRRAVPRRPGDRRPARHLPQRQRHDGHRARPADRQHPVRPAARARQLPDHARLRAAARARAAPGPRRADDPGRGRDRRRRHGARRGVRRRPRRHRHERPGHGPQGRDDRAGGRARAAADRDRRAARRPVDRACRPRPSSRTC